MKKIILLGASGSIGSQTLDVISNHLDEYQLTAFSVGHNIAKLHEIIKQFPVKLIGVSEKADMMMLTSMYPNIRFVYGEEGLCELAAYEDGDVVVNAVVGFRGLLPTLAAIRAKKVLALANKESLVAGGELVKQALKETSGVMYPIDSEHSAIFQCLQSSAHHEIDKLIITASGGSFRDKKRSELGDVTKEQALHHPNWSMGGRITIDSATMMNKGFEVIEAHYLFDISYDNIEVLLHPQSIVHSMVQYRDHAVMAQLGTADMRLPIQYALSYPQRLTMHNSEPLDLKKVALLEFKEADMQRYPLLALAYEAGRKGGNCGAVINGADEEAVALFLNGAISFLDIEEAIMSAYENIPYIEHPTLEELLKSDQDARTYVRTIWRGVLA